MRHTGYARSAPRGRANRCHQVTSGSQSARGQSAGGQGAGRQGARRHTSITAVVRGPEHPVHGQRAARLTGQVAEPKLLLDTGSMLHRSGTSRLYAPSIRLAQL